MKQGHGKSWAQLGNGPGSGGLWRFLDGAASKVPDAFWPAGSRAAFFVSLSALSTSISAATSSNKIAPVVLKNMCQCPLNGDSFCFCSCRGLKRRWRQPAWPLSFFVLTPPPANGARLRVSLFNGFDIESYRRDSETGLGFDLFHTAPRLVAMIFTRPKVVLRNHETSRNVDDGCYLCVFTPPTGCD